MTGATDILAAADIGDLFSLIIFIVLAVVFTVAKLAEKWLGRLSERQADERRRRREAAGQGRAPQRPPTRSAQQQAGRKRYPPMPPPVRGRRAAQQAGRVAVPELQLVPTEPVVLEPVARRTVIEPPRPVREPVAPQRVPAGTPERLGVQAEREAVRLQSHMRKLDLLRRQRLTAARFALDPRQTAGEAIDLTNPLTARQAMIFHEIFSPPKALRREPEVWNS